MNAEFDVGVAASLKIDNSILIVKEGKGRFKDLWGLPKGTVEKNESLESAVLRELFEETGIIGEIKGIVAIRNKKENDVTSVFICYEVIALNENIAIDGSEIIDIKFITHDQIEEIQWISRAMKQIVISSLKTERGFQLLDMSDSESESYTLSIPNDIEEYKLEALR